MLTESELEAKLPKKIEDMHLEIRYLDEHKMWQVQYENDDATHGFAAEADTKWKALNLMWADLVARNVIDA